MKKIFLLFLVLITSAHLKLFANTIQNSWTEGIIILKNQQTLKGEIFYDANFEVVQLKVDNKIQTFTAYNVAYFQAYDEVLERSRIFAAVNDNLNKNRKNRYFLEVLIKGDLLLLQKEEFKNLPVHNFFSSDISFRPHVNYSTYVFTEGKLTEIKNFKKDVLPLMADESELISAYIKNRKMDLQQFEHQALIIDYYNYLKDPSRPVLLDQNLARY